MKVYGAISSSHAEDAPLLHNTHTKADEKKPPLFKGALATSSRKTIALAVAGVAACGAVAIVAKGSNGGGNGAAPGAFRLGDALEDAKAGKKDFCSSNLISLSRVKRIRFDSNASDVVVIISLLSFNIAIIMSQILPSSRRLFR